MTAILAGVVILVTAVGIAMPKIIKAWKSR